MSSQWPKGTNKDLLIAIANYLSDILNKDANLLDEIAIDSLTVASESLQTIISPDSDTLPPSKVSLLQLYESHVNNNNNSSADVPATAASLPSQTSKPKSKPKPAQTQQKPTPTPTPTPAPASDDSQRRRKFLEFVKVLTTRNFFRDCKEGSPEYIQRLENARGQWNTRFPNQKINSLQDLVQPPSAAAASATTATATAPKSKKTAAQLKKEGNQLLTQGKTGEAIEKYSQAIEMEPTNAVFFSNRAAAFTYQKNYKAAAKDARHAIELNPEYVKAYVRLGVVLFEMKEFEGALDAYQSALNRTSPSDRNWEAYNEKVEICKQRMEHSEAQQQQQQQQQSGAGNQGMPDMSQFANMFGGGGAGGGGQPDLSSLLSSLGGNDGIANLMKNPMMQQMAQQMMQDPNAMSNMANMMGNMGGGGGGGGGAAASDGNAAGNDGSGSAGTDNNNNAGVDGELRDVMMDLLTQPEKAKQIFADAMTDPEAQEMMADPEIAPIYGKLKDGDFSALIQLSSKPEAMAKVKRLVKKYYKK